MEEAPSFGALRVIGGGLFLPVVGLVGGSLGAVAVTEGSGVGSILRDLKFRFLRIGVAMATNALTERRWRENGEDRRRDGGEYPREILVSRERSWKGGRRTKKSVKVGGLRILMRTRAVGMMDCFSLFVPPSNSAILAATTVSAQFRGCSYRYRTP